FKVSQTNNTADVILLSGASQATVQNCILERNGITTGNLVRSIVTSAGSGAKVIQNNLFTGSVAGGLFSGHKTWNNAVYINGASSTVSILTNMFSNCRTANSLDDFNTGITISGNTYDNCGTFLAFGGTTPTNGQYVLGSNDFTNPVDAIVNLSNVNIAFRLDITSSKLNGAVFNTYPLSTLFLVEAVMYHRGRSGKNGLVYFVAATEYVCPGLTTIQSAVNYGASGDVINVMNGTYTEQLEINKNLTITGAGIGATNVVSPITLTVSFVTGSNTNKPIIYIHDASNVNINNMTIDGAGRGNANYRFIGAAYRNAGGIIEYCEVKSVRNNPLDGSQHGVGIYAYADNGTARTLNVNNNTIYDFQKNGTTFMGANLTVNCDLNTVTGAGPLGSGMPAQNGIQVSTGATGSITNNIISNINYTPNTAAACGILAIQASTVVISGNTVTDCQSSIALEYGNGSVTGNTLINNSANMGTTSYWWMMTLMAGTMTVSGNDINGGGNGVGIDGYSPAGSTTNMSVSNNNISNCETGVAAEHTTTGVVNGQIHNNSITDCDYSLYNDQTAAQDATCNWFGTTVQATIASGIYGNFTYIPWLTSGTDGSNDIGFQPTATCTGTCSLNLNVTTDGCQGTATANLEGGINSTYLWSDAQTTQTATGLTNGTYTVTVTDENGCSASASGTVTLNTPPTVTASSINPLIFFGYTLDQKSEITVTSSGGTYLWTMSRDLNCNVANSAGDESLSDGWVVACSCTTASCTTPVGTYTGSSFSATLTSDANFTVVVTDANGCTASSTIHIDAIDARCFTGNSGGTKVQMCHKTGSNNNPTVTLCVAQSAVSALLALGDCIGPCSAYAYPLTCSGYRLETGTEAVNNFVAYPNPTNGITTIEFAASSNNHATLDVYSVTGSFVANVFNGNVTEGAEYKANFDASSVTPGIYFMRLSIGNETTIGKLVIMEK
ncbi:MAG: T9SS type A sorting domain-containing protein, partial [Bacteroidia bacterium]|nr:T9SS type A sorting domain-containing protein [Bacteroidia bacterium]